MRGVEEGIVNLELWILIALDALEAEDYEDLKTILEHLLKGVRGE